MLMEKLIGSMKLYFLILRLVILFLISGRTRISNEKPKQNYLQRKQFVLKPYREFYWNRTNREEKNARNNMKIYIEVHENRNKFELYRAKKPQFLSVFATDRRIYNREHIPRQTFERFYKSFNNDNVKFHANHTKHKLEGTVTQPIPNYIYGNITSRKRRNVENCFKEGSCITNIDHDFPVCYCDLKCKIYNDCCHDSHVNDGFMAKEYDRSVLKLNYTSCVLDIIPDYLGYKRRGYLFVTECPKNETRTDTIEKCEKQGAKQGDVPVTGHDGLVYKNRHCAWCHGVTNFLRWDLKYEFTCKVSLFDLMKVNYSDDVIDMLNPDVCFFSVFPPKMLPKPRVCWNIIPINRNNANNITECLRYQNPAILEQQKLKFPLTRNPLCISYEIISSCAWPANYPNDVYPYHMSAMFNFNSPRKCIESEKVSRIKIYFSTL